LDRSSCAQEQRVRPLRNVTMISKWGFPGPIPIPAVDLVSLESSGEVVSRSEPSINKGKDQVVANFSIGPSHVQGEAFVVNDAVSVPDHPHVLISVPVAIRRADDHSDDEIDATLDHELALLGLSLIRFDSLHPDLSELVTTLANYDKSHPMLQILSGELSFHLIRVCISCPIRKRLGMNRKV
ncbi:hypothetical protein PanWU01x14_299710, partial [Parasponia andersonii]